MQASVTFTITALRTPTGAPRGEDDVRGAGVRPADQGAPDLGRGVRHHLARHHLQPGLGPRQLAQQRPGQVLRGGGN